MLFEIELGKERLPLLIEFHFSLVLRHHLSKEILDLAVDLLVIHQDLHVRGKVLADGLEHDMALLVQERRNRKFMHFGLDTFPEMEQVCTVPEEFSFALIYPSSPNNKANSLGQVEFFDNILESFSLFFVLDFPRDPMAVTSGHQDQVSSGERDVGCQSSSFVEGFLLDHLDKKLLPPIQYVLNPGFFSRFDLFVVTLRVEFGHGKKTVTPRSIIDKSGLKAGLHMDNRSVVDIAPGLLSARSFYVEIHQGFTFYNSHPALPGLGGVDQHSFFHTLSLTIPDDSSRPPPRIRSHGDNTTAKNP